MINTMTVSRMYNIHSWNSKTRQIFFSQFYVSINYYHMFSTHIELINLLKILLETVLVEKVVKLIT